MVIKYETYFIKLRYMFNKNYYFRISKANSSFGSKIEWLLSRKTVNHTRWLDTMHSREDLDRNPTGLYNYNHHINNYDNRYDIYFNIL